MTLLAAMWCFGSIQKIHIKLVFHQPGLLDQIRVKKAIVFWSKSVWFSQAVPRFSFIVWLVVKNRLSIGDAMRACVIEQSFVLCVETETRDHVFLACPYSFTV